MKILDLVRNYFSSRSSTVVDLADRWPTPLVVPGHGSKVVIELDNGDQYLGMFLRLECGGVLPTRLVCRVGAVDYPWNCGTIRRYLLVEKPSVPKLNHSASELLQNDLKNMTQERDEYRNRFLNLRNELSEILKAYSADAGDNDTDDDDDDL